MPSLFSIGKSTEGSQDSTQRQARQVNPRDRMLRDLLSNAVTGQLVQPQQYNIPTPMGQAIGGLQSILPSLLGGAFGPNRGVAGLLGGAPLGGGQYPSFGAAPTREALNLQTPRIIPPGFAPPTEEVAAATGRIRVPSTTEKERRLEGRVGSLQGRQAERSAAGKPTKGVEQKIGKAERRLSRYQQSPKFLEATGG